MAQIVHFEIHAADPQALIDYYSGLLGWRFRKLDMGEAEYWGVETGAPGEASLNGGLLRRSGASPVEMQSVNAFVCTVEVDALDEALSRNEALGGRVALPKMAVGGVGWLAYVMDPDGNVLGLMEPDERAS